MEQIILIVIAIVIVILTILLVNKAFAVRENNPETINIKNADFTILCGRRGVISISSDDGIKGIKEGETYKIQIETAITRKAVTKTTTNTNPFTREISEETIIIKPEVTEAQKNLNQDFADTINSSLGSYIFRVDRIDATSVLLINDDLKINYEQLCGSSDNQLSFGPYNFISVTEASPEEDAPLTCSSLDCKKHKGYTVDSSKTDFECSGDVCTPKECCKELSKCGETDCAPQQILRAGKRGEPCEDCATECCIEKVQVEAKNCSSYTCPVGRDKKLLSNSENITIGQGSALSGQTVETRTTSFPVCADDKCTDDICCEPPKEQTFTCGDITCESGEQLIKDPSFICGSEEECKDICCASSESVDNINKNTPSTGTQSLPEFPELKYCYSEVDCSESGMTRQVNDYLCGYGESDNCNVDNCCITKSVDEKTDVQNTCMKEVEKLGYPTYSGPFVNPDIRAFYVKMNEIPVDSSQTTDWNGNKLFNQNGIINWCQVKKTIEYNKDRGMFLGKDITGLLNTTNKKINYAQQHPRPVIKFKTSESLFSNKPMEIPIKSKICEQDGNKKIIRYSFGEHVLCYKPGENLEENGREFGDACTSRKQCGSDACMIEVVPWQKRVLKPIEGVTGPEIKDANRYGIPDEDGNAGTSGRGKVTKGYCAPNSWRKEYDKMTKWHRVCGEYTNSEDTLSGCFYSPDNDDFTKSDLYKARDTTDTAVMVGAIVAIAVVTGGIGLVVAGAIFGADQAFRKA
jgi:hypothetical protein